MAFHLPSLTLVPPLTTYYTYYSRRQASGTVTSVTLNNKLCIKIGANSSLAIVCTILHVSARFSSSRNRPDRSKLQILNIKAMDGWSKEATLVRPYSTFYG